MKTSKKLWAGVCVVAAVALVGCGGGGSSSSSTSTTSFDFTEFLGTWKFNNGQASGNPAGCVPLQYSNSYGSLYRPSVYTANTITDTLEVYSDMSCTTYLGLLVLNYSVAWSAGALPGKSHVARALVTSTGFSLSHAGAPGYTLTSVPQSGVVSKEVLDVEGTLMYNSDFNAPKDTDGYPTALRSPAWYTR